MVAHSGNFDARFALACEGGHRRWHLPVPMTYMPGSRWGCRADPVRAGGLPGGAHHTSDRRRGGASPGVRRRRWTGRGW